MELSPDTIVYWQWGVVKINATLLFTWISGAILVLGSWLVTRRLRVRAEVGKGQAFLEMVVTLSGDKIRDATREEADAYLPLVGTLFLFIVFSTFLAVIPGVRNPAGSLSTTGALALCVFVAVPAYGIASKGLAGYLKHYVSPTPFMLPFHVIGEVSRTVALAIRLFGNIMSGRLIVAILLSIVPFVFPAIMEAFGLLIGFIQAYVFAILALVYIASGTRTVRDEREGRDSETGDEGRDADSSS